MDPMEGVAKNKAPDVMRFSVSNEIRACIRKLADDNFGEYDKCDFLISILEDVIDILIGRLGNVKFSDRSVEMIIDSAVKRALNKRLS